MTCKRPGLLEEKQAGPFVFCAIEGRCHPLPRGLSLSNQVEEREELREADGGGFGALDERLAFGP